MSKKLKITLGVCIVIAIGLGYLLVTTNTSKEETYKNMTVISEKEFESLPILDLGDGQATEEGVKPADIIGTQGDTNGDTN